MKLGQRLQNIIDEKNREKANAKALEEKRRLEEKARVRARRIHMVDAAINVFVDSIESGKIPTYMVKNYDDQRWIENAVAKTADDQSVWDIFTQWAKDNGLQVVVKHYHDGVGIRSWIVLSVEPL